MYIFMGHMRYKETKPFEDSYWDQQRIGLLRAWVTQVDSAAKKLTFHDGGTLQYDKLLIASGSKPNKFGWPGQDLEGVQGLWGLYDLHSLYETAQRTRHAVIVGGGLIGIELAEMLHSRGVHITFLVRERSYWNRVLPAEESSMINEIIRESGMDLRLETELKEILGDDRGRARAIVTSKGETIECQCVGLTAGVSPNIDFLEGSSIPTGRGVLVDWSLKSEVPDVFSAGDCAELIDPSGKRNTVQQVWYTGKMQGEVAADNICGDARTYDPGLWFNSAKFLDLEYQTYGQVNFNVPGEESLYWEAADRRHSLRIVHVDGVCIGFNLMGIRWRHEVCERWLQEKRTVDYVIDHLRDAHFDPEFYTRYEKQIESTFRSEIGRRKSA